jgi:zinc ribbon protein
MYCPKCGKENSQDQRFCRSCGFSLELFSQVVDQGLQPADKDAISGYESRTRTSVWQNPLIYGLFLIILGVIITAIGKRVIGEQAVVDVGTVISMVGVAFFVIRGLFLLHILRPLFHSLRAAPPVDLPKADTTTQLAPLLEAKEQPEIKENPTPHFDPAYAERHEKEAINPNRSTPS